MQEDAYKILEFLMSVERRILRRGRVYYQNNLVEYVRKSGNLYTAEVSGSKLYTVEIAFSEDGGVQSWQCSCPYDWSDICKHTVAVLLAVQAGEYEETTGIPENPYTKEELLEAKRQIDSTLHKLRVAVKTFRSKENPNRYQSQITLAERRIKAFQIANHYIEAELAEVTKESP
ncbi:MAG: SWIM zinc finger family protein [Oscillospiraceae bacterium]|nr:SWIM zinc finger family protein [Oscillospiraceae bacterium]